MTWNFEKVYGGPIRPLGGLAWDGQRMLVTDINDGALIAFDPIKNQSEVIRRHLNRVNGIAFGDDGALYGCQEGSRRVIRMLDDGSATITTTQIHGETHNHPHLLVVDKIPKEKYGVYMGIINMMIVIPMLIQNLSFGYILKHFLNNDPGKAISFAGVLLLLAAVATLFIQSSGKKEYKDA
jgi:hypothetical protein